jgi:site-specific DNA-methyltransferase (adenine-specific)
METTQEYITDVKKTTVKKVKKVKKTQDITKLIPNLLIQQGENIEEKKGELIEKGGNVEEKEEPIIILNESTKIINGDCLEVMKNIESDSIHLILCDLPYGTTKCKWDSVINMDSLWSEYKRIIKKPSGVIVLFGQQPFTTKLISGNYEWFKYNLIWKKNKTTQYLLANYRPMKCTEDICVFSPGGAAAASKHKGNMTYNPQNLIPVSITKKNSEKRIGKMLNQSHHLGPNNKLISNAEYKQSFTNYPTEILEFDIENDTFHETQKPVSLIEYLIKTYSNENDLVLDNTMGSGTTGIGCINNNRKFIGIELEKKYFDLSYSRLNKALQNQAQNQNTDNL